MTKGALVGGWKTKGQRCLRRAMGHENCSTFDGIDEGWRNANVDDVHRPSMVDAHPHIQADFRKAESDCVIRADGGTEGCPGIRIQSGRNVYCNDLASRTVDRCNGLS